jgi:hypothetical protein
MGKEHSAVGWAALLLVVRSECLESRRAHTHITRKEKPAAWIAGVLLGMESETLRRPKRLPMSRDVQYSTEGNQPPRGSW